MRIVAPEITHKPAVGDASLYAQVIEICGHFEL